MEQGHGTAKVGMRMEIDGMTYFNERTKELKDKKIISALKKCAEWYENGAIIEVHDELLEIINAIEAFDK